MIRNHNEISSRNPLDFKGSSEIMHRIIMAREYVIKAALETQKIAETYSKDNPEIFNKIAESCFDLSISLINSMNRSTEIVDLFTSEIEVNNVQ